MIRVIAIDPGVNTAVAVLADGKYEHVYTATFWRAYETLCAGFQPLDVNAVVVEIATDTYIWQPNARNRASVAKALRVAQDVGAVRREGELLAEGLRDRFTVITRPPPGKLAAEPFRLLTGHEGRTNQHERDAGLLAWNEYQALKRNERATA